MEGIDILLRAAGDNLALLVLIVALAYLAHRVRTLEAKLDETREIAKQAQALAAVVSADLQKEISARRMSR